jgi:O-antigen/teichoic acid export membrane protein
MRTISKIAINVGSSYVSMGLTAIINILLIPYVIGILGREVFGIVVFIQSFQFLVGMAGSGLNQAFVRLYALNYAKSEESELAGYYSNAVFITTFIVSPLTIALTVLLTVTVIPLFNITPEMLLAAQIVMVIFGVFGTLSFLSSPHLAVCAAAQKFYIQNFWEIIYFLVFAACVVGFLWLWPSIIAYGLAFLVGRLVFYAGVYFSAKKVLPYCVYRYSLVRWAKIRDVLSISILVLIPNLSSNIYTSLNQMIINAFLGPLYNTYFEVCLVWQRMMIRILSTVGFVMAPQMTTYQAKEQWRQIGEGLLRATKYSFLVGLPIGGMLAMMPGPIFEVWLGPGYKIAAQAMFWIALILPWMAAQLPVIPILVALGKVRFPSILSPSIAIFNLATVLAGVIWFDFGLVAISIVMFACMFLRYGLILPIYSAIQCRISYRRYILQSYCRGVIAFLPAALFLFFVKDKMEAWTILDLFWRIAIAALIYCISIWLVALDSWDKNLIFSYATKVKYVRNWMNKRERVGLGLDRQNTHGALKSGEESPIKSDYNLDCQKGLK